LTESLVLSSIGGVLGLVLAHVGAKLLVAWNPASIPRVAEVTVSVSVLTFTLAASLATGLLFSLAPVLQASKLELTRSLKEGGQSATVGSRRQLFRNAVVVAEIALAVVLVLCAGLMVRSFWELLRVDTGFRSDRVLTLRLSLPQESYPEPEDVVRFYGELQDRLRTLPGISEAGAVRGLPLSGVIGDWSILIEGRPPVPGNNPKGDWQVVSPGYFEAMGMELVRGRFFDKGDRSGAREVAMINETMARMYWPDEDPIGQRFQMGTRGGRPWITIIGVVGDVVHNGLTVAVKEKFYRPHAQFHHSTNFSPRSMTFVIQTSSEPMGFVSSVRREIRAMDSNLPTAEIRTLDHVLEDAVSEPRFTTFLLGVFAAAALLLAAVGIYGVMSYSVSQRTHEIGIRMALGAGRGRVLGMVLKRGVGLTVLGSAVGVGLALWLTRWMASLLYGVGARDLETFLAVPSALFLVALVASYVPSRRATRVHPVTALRME
jgi:putative ABC transport system permease protein